MAKLGLEPRYWFGNLTSVNTQHTTVHMRVEMSSRNATTHMIISSSFIFKIYLYSYHICLGKRVKDGWFKVSSERL